MRYRPLGSAGPMVSLIGLGGNNFGRRIGLEETRAVVDAAVEEGITLVDTADIYGDRGGSESILGEVLQGRRDMVVLATKFGMDMGDAYGRDPGPRGSRRYIRVAIEGSLRRLQTDRVDLYQYHTPDGITPLAETLGALDELVREGKVHFIGSSNFDAAQVGEAEEISRQRGLARFVSAQNEYNLLNREVERELALRCERIGVGILPYFPLASGLLTGKYRRGEPPPPGSRLEGRGRVFTDENFDRLEALEKFAADRGLTLLDVAIGGLAAQPAVASVIPGATKPDQVRSHARAGDWEPSAEDLVALDEIVPGPR